MRCLDSPKSRSPKWSLAGLAPSSSLRRCDLGYDHGPNIQALRLPDQRSRTLVIRRSRSFRDFAYREFLCHIPLTPPMCRSTKFQSLATCPLAPTARIVSRLRVSRVSTPRSFDSSNVQVSEIPIARHVSSGSNGQDCFVTSRLVSLDNQRSRSLLDPTAQIMSRLRVSRLWRLEHLLPLTLQSAKC
jgi:hypothetical protein